MGGAVPADRPEGRRPHLRGRDPGEQPVRQGRSRLHPQGRHTRPAAPRPDRVQPGGAAAHRHRGRRDDGRRDLVGVLLGVPRPDHAATPRLGAHLVRGGGEGPARRQRVRRGGVPVAQRRGQRPDRGVRQRDQRAASGVPTSGSSTTTSTPCRRAATPSRRRTSSARSATRSCGASGYRPEHRHRIAQGGHLRGQPSVAPWRDGWVARATVADMLSHAVDVAMDRTVAPGFSKVGPAVRRRLPGWPGPTPNQVPSPAPTSASPVRHSGLGIATAVGLRAPRSPRSPGRPRRGEGDWVGRPGPRVALRRLRPRGRTPVRGRVRRHWHRSTYVVHNAGSRARHPHRVAAGPRADHGAARPRPGADDRAAAPGPR